MIFSFFLCRLAILSSRPQSTGPYVSIIINMSSASMSLAVLKSTGAKHQLDAWPSKGKRKLLQPISPRPLTYYFRLFQKSNFGIARQQSTFKQAAGIGKEGDFEAGGEPSRLWHSDNFIARRLILSSGASQRPNISFCRSAGGKAVKAVVGARQWRGMASLAKSPAAAPERIDVNRSRGDATPRHANNRALNRRKS